MDKMIKEYPYYIATLHSCLLLVVISINLITPCSSHAQSSEREVYLSFQYRGTVNQVVTAYYKPKKKQFFLPLTELLNLLEIPYEVNQEKLQVTGNYLGAGKNYVFDFKNRIARYKEKYFKITASDYLIKELDYFVRPKLLHSLLDLNFKIDFNSLSISLRTDDIVPVVSKQRREQRRQREIQKPQIIQENYPLKFDRTRDWLDGGFLDYNLSSSISNGNNFFTYSATFGGELLGGDIQGSGQGSWSRLNTNFNTSGIRWRYVMRDNNWLTNVRIGQNSTGGIKSRQFTGLQLTNDPVEPRISFDEYVIQGQATPQSEVELYLNNTLINFQKADELGNYRFVAPLTYGSTRYRIKIFTPSGGVETIRRRIQIPFEFQKPGKIQYEINAGKLNQPLFGTTKQGYMAQSDFSYGLSKKLTLGGGFEYLESSTLDRPLFYSSLNTRILTSHLVNIKAAPGAFYRLQSNAVYPSSAGWSMDYTYYTSNNLYNIGGLDHELNGDIFTPFTIGNLQFNARLFARHTISEGINLTRYRADISTRINRLTLRLGLNDQQIDNLEFGLTNQSRASGSFSYTLSRRKSLPVWLQGAFIRGNIQYLPGSKELNRASLELSRSIAQTGRIRIRGGRDFSSLSNRFMLSFTYNFKTTRSNTTARVNGNSQTLSQSFRGTIGYDSHNNEVILDNRQQVGRGAAAVRLFIDENNNGNYDPGEQLIKDNAVKLHQAGNAEVDPDGIIRISQIRAYNRLNANIQTSALSNPLYTPEIDTFSFVSDPNQYKPIDIPFYQSGVISGHVYRQKPGEKKAQPQSGVRLFIEGEDNFQKKLRTFSNGSFYSMEIPPGKYAIFIDRSQLEFLNAISKPDTIHITVESKAQGDFIEGLKFTILQPNTNEENSEKHKSLDREKSQRKRKDINQLKKANNHCRERKSYNISLLNLHQKNCGLVKTNKSVEKVQ